MQTAVDSTPSPAAGPTAGPRVLIVDDEDQKRLLIARFLRRTLPGIEIHECGGGGEARELLEVAEVDVVLTDNRMPGMSGLELTRWIRQRKPDLPVVLVTGHPDIERSAREAGVTKLIDFARYAEIGQLITDILQTRKPS
jgi:Response regulator containing CheY-like receiver, AAA-type ATPase, and DNA-binding domains